MELILPTPNIDFSVSLSFFGFLSVCPQFTDARSSCMHSIGVEKMEGYSLAHEGLTMAGY